MKNTKKQILNRIFTFILTVMSTFGITTVHAEDEKKTVELTYVEWASEVASTYVVKVVLEELGYKVELIPVSAAVMWQAVASGDVDGHVAAWLKSTHAHYLNAVTDRIENLGPNLEGTKIGLVVPQYVTINSIEELKADKFKRKIIGIDPGAGLMSKTEQVIKAYKLKNFKLMEGSGATMAAALSDAIKNKRWIVVTGWTPHWMFSRWDLKYLSDPKGLFNPSNGREEYISTIVRQGLKEDKPEVYRLLDKFYWKASDMEQVMIWNEKKTADPYENAKRWVKENRDKVKTWLSP